MPLARLRHPEPHTLQTRDARPCNPAPPTPWQIDKLVLEAQFAGDASQAPREYMTVTSTTQASGRRPKQ